LVHWIGAVREDVTGIAQPSRRQTAPPRVRGRQEHDAVDSVMAFLIVHNA